MHYVVFQHSPKNSMYCSKRNDQFPTPNGIGIRDAARDWLAENDVTIISMYECTVANGHKRQLVIYYKDKPNDSIS